MTRRSGGGGGSRRSSSGGSRRSSSRSHSSSRSSSSSFSSRPSSRPYSSPSRHYGGTNIHNTTIIGGGYSANRGYYGTKRPSVIGNIFSSIFVIVIIFFIFVIGGLGSIFDTSTTANKIDEEAVAQYAESLYQFDDESHLLLVYAYFDDTDTDTATLIFGNTASDLISTDLEDYFWERYDDNFYSDLNESEWLGNTFAETAKEYLRTTNGEKSKELKNFNKGCYDDGLDFIYSNEKQALIDGCKKFYDATGVQPYIVLVDYEDIPGVVVQESTAGRFGNRILTIVIFVAIGGAVIFIAKKAIDKKKKEEEELEKTLNTPLEKFGDLETEDLKSKYDNMT